MTMVLTMNADSNSAGISISNSKKRVRKEEGNEFEMEFGVDGKGRKSFTPGWEKSLRVKDALPIKQNGKLIRVTRESVDNNANDEDGTDEEEGELEDDKGDKRIGKINSNDSDKAKEKQPKKKKIPVILNEKVFVEHTPLSETRIKKKIAAICMSITANPEDCFTKKGANDTDDKQKYKVSDLLSLMETTDASEFELVIMSALLVFRDIIPGYKIRMAENSSTAAAPLKKETKAMREFELSLLKAYEKFLYVLDQTVLDGLGNPKQPVDKWNLKAKLGLSALRCQCDLIKTVFHFNYRSTLLLSIVTRSAQSSKIIHSMCCDTITTLLKQDKVGDLSVEIVQMFSKVLVAMKHDVPASMLKCLTSVRLTVHADKAKSVRQKAKNERKKRKKADSDDVEVALLESSAVADKTAYQKYQADCLDEVLVIYFRILKQKIGFDLLPIALEGLSRITHLINMDTVEDLISIMRKIIDQISPTPIEVQLQCVHCVLKTLSGPGQELKIDDEYFIQQLKLILKDLPFTFHRWDVVLDCIDLCMLKKREERTPIIISFIRIMLLISIHVNEVIQKLFLCQIHNILLRYPRTRIIIIALQNNIPLIDKDDDKVEDLAMLALKTNNSNVVDDMKEETLQDGTWLFPLIKFSSNPIISNTIDTIISKNLLPLPYHINDANYDVNDQAVKRLTDCFRLIPSSITKINNNNNNVSTSSNNTSNKNVKTKKGDAISNSNHKKKHSNNDNRNNFGQQKKSPQKKKWNKK